MRFFTALVATAAVAQAATIKFWSLDEIKRTIYFTANAGSGFANIEPVVVDCTKNVTVTFPDVWIGNYYAVQIGAVNKPGMLGEINFGGWMDLTYFDVSAIVDPTDINNVKQMWPAKSAEPMSGCASHPCNNVYWLPDDVQTKTTPEKDLICTLGTGVTGMSFAEAQ